MESYVKLLFDFIYFIGLLVHGSDLDDLLTMSY